MNVSDVPQGVLSRRAVGLREQVTNVRIQRAVALLILVGTVLVTNHAAFAA